MADTTPNPIENATLSQQGTTPPAEPTITPTQSQPTQITPEPIQGAEPTITPFVAYVPIAIPQVEVTPTPVVIPGPTPVPAAPSMVTESVIDKIMKFKLYVIIFASIIGLATVGYVTYSFFFSGTTEISQPPSVSSPFDNTTTAEPQTTDITSEKSTDSSNPPSLGGGNTSTTSQNNELEKTIQDLKDVSTGTDQIYDNAVLEETTPIPPEVTKKIPR